MRTTLRITLIYLMICACSLETNAKYISACEDHYTSLDCGSDVIDVKVANYGRSNRITCSFGRPCRQLSNTSCLADHTLSRVKKRCDGRRLCSIKASSHLFSDPCVGTHKYLEVLYLCVPPPERSDVTCEGHHGILDCGSHVIQVQSANYGRTDGSVCADGIDADQVNTNCISPHTLYTVKHICEGRTSCELRASNSIFSNPCPGTHKYLNVSYSCVPSKSRQICEGHAERSLECGSKVIEVHAANYGRTDNTTCAAGRDADQINNTDCLSAHTLTKVKEICEGRTSCKFKASNSIFSNRCPGTHKYLNVSYSCVFPNSSLTCEGKKNRMKINCGSVHVIKVHCAIYGRTSATVCSSHRPAHQISNTSCHSDVLSTVRNRCEGMKSCNIPVKNKFFSNPCRGTHKYLNVSYNCVPLRSSQICEGHNSTLDCGANGQISIHNANFKPTGGLTCSAGLPASDSHTCFSTVVRYKVKLRCEERQTCVVAASSDDFFDKAFRDPCPQMDKYLDITYACTYS